MRLYWVRVPYPTIPTMISHHIIIVIICHTWLLGGACMTLIWQLYRRYHHISHLAPETRACVR